MTETPRPPTAGPPTDSFDDVPEAPFDRRLFGGYDRTTVDVWYRDSEHQVLELRNELMGSNAAIVELELELDDARRELRFWHDRQTFVEDELERVRDMAARIEAEARARAAESEENAQQRAVTMIDRACAEASTIVANARDEAREIMARYEGDLDLEQRRVERMTALQQQIARSMRDAMAQFEEGMRQLEEGMRQLDRAAPTAQAADFAPRPTRRRPTFGRTRAIEAATGGDPRAVSADHADAHEPAGYPTSEWDGTDADHPSTTPTTPLADRADEPLAHDANAARLRVISGPPATES